MATASVQKTTTRNWTNMVLASQVCGAEALVDLLHNDLGLTKNQKILHNLFSDFKQKHYNSLKKVIRHYQWDVFCHVCSAQCPAPCPKQGVTNLGNLNIIALASVYQNLQKLLPDLDAQTISDFEINYRYYVKDAITNRNFILHTPFISIDNIVIDERIRMMRSILIRLRYSNMDRFDNYRMEAQEDEDVIIVGKIRYNANDELGNGSPGKIMYKGEFDKRKVAVKKIMLSGDIEYQEREVELLRKLNHPNVIRYFYTETDKQFRYIAMEWCQTTLHDYITKPRNDEIELKPTQVLYQTLSGLTYLHSLDIVHRNIKPHNILISYPNPDGKVKAMISDFGLCKELPSNDTISFPSRRRIGTDGWIAPEMCKETFKCDIFSYGCVFYYVLSGGAHPFGDNDRRQENILDENYTIDMDKLNILKNKNEARDVVEKMLDKNQIDRPDASTILKHPFFWKKEKKIDFFQDVSNRIKKDDEIIKTLQNNSKKVIGDDWMKNICTKLQKELNLYDGAQVKELLRAIRNKIQHPPEFFAELLGTTQDKIVKYFMEPFPRLLMHTYNSLRKFLEIEEQFQKYYL